MTCLARMNTVSLMSQRFQVFDHSAGFRFSQHIRECVAGVRVADFSHVIAGPLATQFLCLLGADVIKVEPPSGDAMRYYTRKPEFHGMAEPFVGANAGKKSVLLDLKTDAGRAALLESVEQWTDFSRSLLKLLDGLA